MANGKEARNGEERGETANEQQSPPRRRKIDEKEGLAGLVGWKGCSGWRVAVVASVSAASQRRRCAICSQQEKPELIKARNYLRFEPFVLTGVSCPI